MALMNPETGEKLNPGELKEPVTFTIPVNPSVHNTSYNSTVCAKNIVLILLIPCSRVFSPLKFKNSTKGNVL